MSNYIGVRCPVCNKKFTQSDDIVVCPICGAPHHRSCYAEKNACAFAADHISGKEWRAPAPSGPADSHEGSAEGSAGNAKICHVCNSANPSDGVFCQICGSRIAEVQPPHAAEEQGQRMWGFPPFAADIDPVLLMYGGVSPDDKIEEESVRELAVYIGENSAYYLPRFKNMFDNSRTLSFNFSALIFGFIYFFYRKMNIIGAVMLVLFIVGAVPSVFLAREQFPQLLNEHFHSQLAVNHAAIAHYQYIVNITGTINSLICLVVSFCANRFYYLKAVGEVKKIREGKTEAHDEIAYNNSLSQKGGVSRTAVIIIFSLIIAAYFIIGFYLAFTHMNAGGIG